ncbi:hypothetical protein ABZ840_03370 [Streptomyces sp. NPDC047117]|uniref:hypothetical protein n=1 Tax=unclassified Streptomyces TaxID=2593676 RepID=UPI0033C7471A
MVGDALVLRVLVAAAAVAAVGGAVLARRWDRTAGKRVADLTRARVRDEWRTEERIAELETDVEEGREIRTALETKLRAKRAELARLRNEHAALLRRYATAETERATALEGRRRLAIDAAAPARELTAGGAVPVPGLTAVAPAAVAPVADGTAAADIAPGAPGAAARTARTAPTAPAGRGPAHAAPAPAPTAADFRKADEALLRLNESAVRQEAARQEAARRAERERAERQRAAEQARAAAQVRGASAGVPALRPVPAAAVAPLAPQHRPASRATGGFDFFGTGTAAPDTAGTDTVSASGTVAVPKEAPAAPLEEDLADVVGDEAVAEQSARATAAPRPAQPLEGPAPAAQEAAEISREAEPRQEPAAAENGAEAAAGAEPGTDERTAESDTAAESESTAGAESGSGSGERAAGEVIDLTAHDETEQFDVAELRSAAAQ